ncbi:MAG: hypothetical protein ACLP01_27550 [Solirubrobacteraceae bacterium]
MHMSTARARRMVGRARQIWGELDYTQRRLFEVRTGVPTLTPEERARLQRILDERRLEQRALDELEEMWARPSGERPGR